MTTKHIFSVNVDFSQRELLNAVLQNLFQPPLLPREGQVYYDSFYNVPHYWNEIEWVPWERPIHKKYVNQSAMIADQEYQLKQFIYWDGSTYWEYLGTTNGNITDYNPFGSTYVHPSYTPFDLTLSGATVIENIETDNIGSVVNLSVRQLQLSDLGFSGDTNADFYGNWILHVNGTEFYVVESENILNIQAGDNITLDTSGNTLTISSQDTIYIHPSYSGYNLTLTGSTVISEIITDEIGSVVNIETRNLTLLDLGFSGDTNADFYGNWILNINGLQTYIVGSEDIINIQEGDNVTINTSGNTITISSQDTIYTHPLYDIINLTLSGATVLSTLLTDEIGSVLSATTRTLTPQDIGAEPAFNKGNIIIPVDSGISFTGDTENRLVGIGDLTLVNNDKGSDQNIFKEIRDISGNTAISATTNNDFIQIEGENGTEVRFESGNRIIIDSPIQDNFVRVLYVPCDFVDFNLPLKPQIVNYINQLDPPLVIDDNESKYNIVIDCEQSGTTVSCESGMDVLFLLDYTQSMDAAIDNIKLNINSIVENIKNKSGENYRLALAIFDENSFNGQQPTYSGSTFYQSLLSDGQVYIHTGNDNDQIITLITDFSNNNLLEFKQNLDLIKTNDFPLGNGNRSAEPYDMGLDICINGTPFTGSTRTQFLSPFRDNVNKQIIIITDTLPSGSDDIYNLENVDFINGVLKNDILNENIILSLLSPLLNAPGISTTGIGYIKDSFIFDGFSRNFTLSNRIFSKLNIRINLSNSALAENLYTINYKTNVLTIDNSVIINNGDQIDIYYRDNAILNIVYESNGIYTRDYSSTEINNTINNICGSPSQTVIYQITGYGLGNSPLDACLNYNANQNLYTYSETIGINSVLYYDDAGSLPVNNFDYVSINNIVYQLNETGTIVSINSLNCNDIIITYQYNGIGYGNTSQDACDDAVNNRTLYSNCDVITTGCTLYFDTYGLNPFTGYTQVLIENQVWDVDNTNGDLLNVSSTQCITQIIYTFNNSGYGNTTQDACVDADTNNRTLYSDCSIINTGCTIYFNISGTTTVTGFTKVFIDNRVWDINDITGEIISLSSTQCLVPSLNEFTGVGYGNTVSNACNDAILFNRTVYTPCSIIDVGCEIFTDITGDTPLTGFNYISINNTVWEMNLTNTILVLSPVQC